MIGWIERQLKRWGVIPAFDKDEMLNAQADDKLHDFESVAHEVRQETNKRRRSNAHLRFILNDAKARTNGFANLERLVRTQGEQDRE